MIGAGRGDLIVVELERRGVCDAGDKATGIADSAVISSRPGPAACQLVSISPPALTTAKTRPSAGPRAVSALTILRQRRIPTIDLVIMCTRLRLSEGSRDCYAASRGLLARSGDP
jgi:hypothetical protein